MAPASKRKRAGGNTAMQRRRSRYPQPGALYGADEATVHQARHKRTLRLGDDKDFPGEGEQVASESERDNAREPRFCGASACLLLLLLAHLS